MNYWVVKARPQRSDLHALLARGGFDRWETRKPPRAWSVNDGLFFWQGAPALHLVGFGTLEQIHPPTHSGDTHFDVRYRSAPLAHPLGIDELRKDPVLGGASFLKAAVAGTLFPLTPAQAHRLAEYIVTHNPSLRRTVGSWLVRRNAAGRVLLSFPGVRIQVRKSALPPPVAAELPNRAISVRQPYVEQILRGVKTFEYRSSPTKIRSRVYLYAALQPGAEAAWKSVALKPGDLATGAILGSVEIVGCEYFPAEDHFGYALANPERLLHPLKPTNHPQPRWFVPF